MNDRSQNKRVLIVVSLLTAAFAALGFRLVDLHVIRHDELLKQANAIRERVVHRQGKRGDILDARGELLATTLAVQVVTADPSITTTQAVATAKKLAPILNLDETSLAARLSGPGRYVRLKQKVDENAAQKIRALKLKGVMFEDQFVRSYPHGQLASHVVGFVDSECNGVQGIESSMERYLQGQAGYEVIERDRRGREIRALRNETLSPRDGYNVELTIDTVIQDIAEKAIEKAMIDCKPRAAVVIVSRPKTGEILAMSCRPTFDLNGPGAAPADSRRNRCISDVAEPGSTFKIVVISGAMNEGVVGLNDRFDCENGAWLYAGRILHSSHPFGILPVEMILVKSDNIGAAKIGLKLGASRLAEYIRRYGFGRKTGIVLPGEVSGIAHPLSKWTGLSITRIPMGHEIAATPLQMVMAMNAIANGGNLMKPMIVKRLLDTDGVPMMTYAPQLAGTCIAPRTTEMMTTAMRKVVGPDGTASKAAVEGYDVAGKTGTAQKIENGQYVRKYYSSFIGYLPASNPELSILVSIDDPTVGYYGGSVAGPVFRTVAEQVAQYLSIPPQITNPKTLASLR